MSGPFPYDAQPSPVAGAFLRADIAQAAAVALRPVVLAAGWGRRQAVHNVAHRIGGIMIYTCDIMGGTGGAITSLPPSVFAIGRGAISGDAQGIALNIKKTCAIHPAVYSRAAILHDPLSVAIAPVVGQALDTGAAVVHDSLDTADAL